MKDACCCCNLIRILWLLFVCYLYVVELMDSNKNTFYFYFCQSTVTLCDSVHLKLFLGEGNYGESKRFSHVLKMASGSVLLCSFPLVHQLDVVQL